MIRDITIGQFFPVKSFVHSLDPRTKILFTLIYVVLIFVCTNLWSYLFLAACTFFVMALSMVPFKMYIKGLKPLMFLIFFTAILNTLMTKGEAVTILGTKLEYGFVRITREGLILSAKMALRIIFLVLGTSVLTFTTSPIVLTDGIERLLSPFKKIGVPAHELAMMMTIAMRFIPTLIEETDKIIKAQSARGADFDTGGIIQKIKAMIPIFVPLFISSFRRADELATAMECRLYRGGEGRTRLRELKATKRDFFAALFCAVFIFGTIALSILF